MKPIVETIPEREWVFAFHKLYKQFLSENLKPWLDDSNMFQSRLESCPAKICLQTRDTRKRVALSSKNIQFYTASEDLKINQWFSRCQESSHDLLANVDYK